MPRGIPNARRDEDGVRYTTFHVPLAPNPKHMLSNYLKAESQSIWARNAQKKSKARQEEVVPPQDARCGSYHDALASAERTFQTRGANHCNSPRFALSPHRQGVRRLPCCRPQCRGAQNKSSLRGARTCIRPGHISAAGRRGAAARGFLKCSRRVRGQSNFRRSGSLTFLQ
jgi:hypothetical protein